MSTKLDRPKTNVPRTGVITAAWYAPSSKPNYKDEVKLVGNWEREGEGFWYASQGCVEALCRAGVLRQVPGQTDKDGHPKFEVAVANQRVMIQKVEGDGNTKYYQAFAVDAAGNQVQLVAQPDPVFPAKSAAPSPAPAPAAPAVTGAPIAPPAASAPIAPAATAVPTAAPAPAAAPAASPKELKEHSRRDWLRIREAALIATDIAAEALHEATGVDVAQLDQHAIVRLTNELLVLADKNAPGLVGRTFAGLRRTKDDATPSTNGTPPKPASAPVPAAHAAAPSGRDLFEKTDARAETYDDFPSALEDDDDDDLPF